jgi:hypothetical protein
MKVSELIAELSKLPQDVEVILSRDPEGNGFYTVEDVEASYYDPDDYDLSPIHPNDLEEYNQAGLAVGVFIWP